MARIRRLTAVAGVAALATTFVTGPAQADSPEVFQGSASGTALDLAVLGRQLTLGASSATADSTGKAEATGAGVLSTSVPEVDNALALKSTQKTAKASNGSSDVQPKTCGKVVALNDVSQGGKTAELSKVLQLGLACSAASATSGAAPVAKGEGSVVEAGVDAASLIQEVEDVTGQELSDTVQGIGTTVAGLLEDVCDAAAGADKGLTCDAGTTVEDLVESVLHTRTLDVEVGKSTSSVVTGDGAVTATASSSGAVVEILPLPQLDGVASSDPVVTIQVGSSKATASYDRTKGSSSGTADPAIVRITFNTVLTKSLADELGNLPVLGRLDNIVIDPGDFLDIQKLLDDELDGGVAGLIESCDDGRAVCILSDSPLASKIYLASSKVTTNPDGSVEAVADAVRMDLVTGIDFSTVNTANNATPTTAGLDLATPGVRLALAGVQAGVGGQPADEDDDGQRNVPAPRTELNRGGGPLPPLELPRTGGLPLLPMLGAGALAAAGMLRRATRRATD